MENTGVKQLAEEVVKAYHEKAAAEVLLPWFSGLADPNESILADCDDSFSFTIRAFTLTIKAMSPQPQFSVFHLQALMWMMCGRSDGDEQVRLALEKQILYVVAAGGDCDLQVVDVQVLCNDSELVCIVHATPREFVLDIIKIPWYHAPGYRHPITEKILDIIEKAKCTVRFSSHNFSQSVVSAWKNLLFSESLSDVTFVCTNGNRCHAHRLVLSAASPYFKTYFTGPWSDQDNGGLWKTEIDSPILETVLTFIYTGNFGKPLLDMSMDNIANILKVGQEFQMPNLVEVCCRVIRENLSLKNIKKMTCVAATVSPPFAGQTDLFERCVNFIRDNMADVLLDTSFIALASEHPELWKRLQQVISPSRKA
jgi:hypothetical protein